MVWSRLFGNNGGFIGLRSVDGPAVVLLPVLLLYLRTRGLATRSIAAWAISLTVGLSVIRGMYWMVDNNFDIPATAAAAQLVLLYFGYVSMAVAAILFWKGTGQTGSFDEDQLAIMGLYVLGVPVYPEYTEFKCKH